MRHAASAKPGSVDALGELYVARHFPPKAILAAVPATEPNEAPVDRPNRSYAIGTLKPILAGCLLQLSHCLCGAAPRARPDGAPGRQAGEDLVPRSR